jgi:hypothetical protein
MLGRFLGGSLAVFAITAFGARASAADDPAAAQAAAVDPTSKPDDPDAKGKFDAGAQLRLPSGPDETGKFGSFHWIAVDAKGRYNPSDFFSAYLTIPLAVKHPDFPEPLPAPTLLGGFTARGDLGLGKTLGIGLTAGLMREGAFLLSEKDYPYFHGDFKPGGGIGPYLRFDMFGLFVSVLPQVIWQSGTGTALQVPLSAKVNLIDVLEVAADAGLYTGPKLALGAKDGGRIYAGASAMLRLGPIKLRLGSGVASLLTDPAGYYPSIKESIYFDFNVRYAN